MFSHELIDYRISTHIWWQDFPSVGFEFKMRAVARILGEEIQSVLQVFDSGLKSCDWLCV